MKVINRKSMFALLAVLFWVSAGSHGSASPFNKLTHFKFSQAVMIPGATLEAGDYLFELVNPNDQRNVVKVTNRQHTKVFGLVMTRST